MKVEIFNRTMIGIAFGAILTFGFLTAFVITDFETTTREIWKHMFASMTIGIYYGLSSFIWTELEKWSPLKKTTVHFFLSIIIYFAVAFIAGWVPFHVTAVVISAIVFTCIYALYWLGYRIYYKRLEASMNRDLQKRQ